MSWLSDLSKHLKQIVLMEDRIERLLDDVETVAETVVDHEKRLIRIETMIEMTQRTTPNPLIADES